MLILLQIKLFSIIKEPKKEKEILIFTLRLLPQSNRVHMVEVKRAVIHKSSNNRLIFEQTLYKFYQTIIIVLPTIESNCIK